jgi:hypothetical protein
MAKRRRQQKPATSPRNVRQGGDAAVTVLKPRKRIPGIEGRSAWFARRAGHHEHALSIERLRAATAAAESMLTRRELVEDSQFVSIERDRC